MESMTSSPFIAMKGADQKNKRPTPDDPDTPTTSEPKNKRKTHIKSRAGCRRCKERRVKCDEGQPVCGACHKRQELCVYEIEKALLLYTATPSTSALRLDTPRNRELALLHHWTAITCESLSSDSGRHEMRVTIPQLALSHEYLLNAMFALTGTHLAYLKPESSQQHLFMALQFHSTSLRAFRSTLASMSPAESPALVYCSVLLGMLAFSLRSVDSQAASPIDTLCQVSNLWHGTRNIKNVAGLSADLFSSSQAPTPADDSPPEDDFSLRVAAFLDKLREAAIDQSEPAATHYTHAIKALDSNIRWPQAGKSAGALRWVTGIPAEMVTLIQNRDPFAMAITLGFATLLKGSNEHWWMERFASDLVAELGSKITPEGPFWEAELNWTRQLHSQDPP